MRIKIYFISALCVALSLATVSCNSDGDKFDYNKKGLLITGTETDPLVKFVVEDTPSTYDVTVKSTVKVDQDVNVTVAIDTTLISKYNEAHHTNFFAAPDGSVELDNKDVTIPAGSALSTAASVKIVDTENFLDGRTYVVPVTISGVKNADGEEVLESSKTIYLKISRVLSFYAVNNNSSASSNFIFDDAKAADLTTFTFEIKCYSTHFGNGGNIERLCSFEEKNESNASMLRFGENGMAGNQLQWVSPAGSVPSATRFATNRWYLISLVYDGSQFIMYVDGVKDAVLGAAGKSCKFQRFEMGMSWGGYNSGQFFPGRFCEVRVWNRALSATEMVNGMCGVDPHSKGLVAYWKMNEGTGSIFKDATGNGYDMDWNNTWRADYEGDLIHHTDYGKNINWVKDANNKCAQ
jgi:hypothetical protein